MQKRDLEVGDVVQIDPAHDPMFGGAFMLVTDPKSWGAQGFIVALPSPGSGRDKPPGAAYYRCKFEDMEYIGKAAWAPPIGE